MPNWGWKLGGAAPAGSGADLSMLLAGGGGGNQGMNMTMDASSGPPPQTATGNPGNVPGQQPNPYERWQGGAPDPRGTQDPQTGRQTGGRYVDPNYGQDATGRPLSPQEQAYWREQDRLRAERGSLQRSAQAAYEGRNADSKAAGIDYNNQTGSWSWLDPKTKQWTSGVTLADIWAKLSPDQQAEHPYWWYENLASSQDTSADIDRNNKYRQAQSNALSGTPSYRSAPVRF